MTWRSARESSSNLRGLGGRAPDHPAKSGDFAGTPVVALKPASRGPALRRCPRVHDAGTPIDALLAAPPFPWLRPPMPRISFGFRNRVTHDPGPGSLIRNVA